MTIASHTRIAAKAKSLVSLIRFASIRLTLSRPFSIMPKTMAPSLPLNGIFPIEKPSGPTSMRVVDSVTSLMLDSKLFEDPERIKHHNHGNKRKRNTTGQGIKCGQGGTLDPLADGVLVMGVNRGTKYLQQYLTGTKEYESIGILGAATTTMDAEGEVLTTGNFDNVTREDIEKIIENFQGEISQVPPIFSALKMEGKPLYEYARENKPLPRAIPTRKCTVSVQLVDFTPAQKEAGDSGHDYHWPAGRLNEEQKGVFRRLTTMVHDAQQSSEDSKDALLPNITDKEWPEVSEVTGLRPATFKVKMTVSGGTYVRSIVHDIGLALGCGAHVVTLRRTRQGRFPLIGDEGEITEELQKELQDSMDDAHANRGLKREELSEEELVNDPALRGEISAGPQTGCVPWSVFEKALEDRKAIMEAQDQELQDKLEGDMADPETMRKTLSKENKRRLRMEGPLKQWELEVLRRFVSVPVPRAGGH